MRTAVRLRPPDTPEHSCLHSNYNPLPRRSLNAQSSARRASSQAERVCCFKSPTLLACSPLAPYCPSLSWPLCSKPAHGCPPRKVLTSLARISATSFSCCVPSTILHNSVQCLSSFAAAQLHESTCRRSSLVGCCIPIG